jgi:hypothetical protein
MAWTESVSGASVKANKGWKAHMQEPGACMSYSKANDYQGLFDLINRYPRLHCVDLHPTIMMTVRPKLMVYLGSNVRRHFDHHTAGFWEL